MLPQFGPPPVLGLVLQRCLRRLSRQVTQVCFLETPVLDLMSSACLMACFTCRLWIGSKELWTPCASGMYMCVDKRQESEVKRLVLTSSVRPSFWTLSNGSSYTLLPWSSDMCNRKIWESPQSLLKRGKNLFSVFTPTLILIVLMFSLPPWRPPPPPPSVFQNNSEHPTHVNFGSDFLELVTVVFVEFQIFSCCMFAGAVVFLVVFKMAF